MAKQTRKLRGRYKRYGRYYLKQRANGTWYVHWTEGSIPKSHSTGEQSEQLAEQYLINFAQAAEAPPSEDVITVKEIIEYYLMHMEKRYTAENRKPAAIRNLKDQLKGLTQQYGNLQPRNINKVLCRGYIHEQRRDGKSDSTIRTRLAFFNRAFTYAYGEGVITQKPAIELPPPAPPKERWLTPQEAQRLLDACVSEHIRLFVTLGLHTASRKGAILDLKWQQVDLERRIIHFNPPGRRQTRKRRVPVPINDTLYAALERARLLAVTDYVIEDHGDAPLKDIKTAFSKTVRRAGLNSVSPHTLRHTAATWMSQRGVPVEQIAAVLGDSVATVSKNYVKWSPEYLVQATNALGVVNG